VRQDPKRFSIPEVFGTAVVRIELYGEVCVRKDYRGCRMLVSILHGLCVKLVTENSGEDKILPDTSVKELGHMGRNARHGLVHY